jgi:integrase
MLILCPECELQVSNKALSCPHCGFPLQENIKPQRKTHRKNKHCKLPNGFGQISEIKNRNLRKPFRAMVTVGKDANGRPICKLLKPESYFATYNDAYAALVEYNKNPYDLNPSITVGELYEKWSEEYFKNLSESSKRSLKNAWDYCSAVSSMRVTELRARHIKGCIDDGFIVVKGEKRMARASAKNRIKSLFNAMLDYAVEYELVDRNYARTFTLNSSVLKDVSTAKNKHIPYTDDEISRLWSNVNTKMLVDAILVQCYSGWRPQELGLIEISNVDLKNDTFTGGMKTESGINRIVPIHPTIKPLVERRYREAVKLGSPYLFNDTRFGTSNTKLTYARFQSCYSMIRDELQLNPAHRPHDGRKHFITMAKKYGVDEYAIKYMVGHAISDITERVYTERDVEWLKTELEKIK